MRKTKAPNVRIATLEDRSVVFELLAVMGDRGSRLAWANPDEPFAALLSAPDARLLLAERDGVLVGAAAIRARRARVFEERKAWMELLAVAANVHGDEIISALLGAGEREAAALGCGVVVLDASTSSGPSLVQPFERAVPSRGRSLAESFLAAAASAATRIAYAIAGLADAGSVGIGADGAPTEAADDAAEQAAIAELLPLGFPIVSEEKGLIGALDPHSHQLWISLDPLDGSRNFVAGYPAYAASVALIRDGIPIAGLVVDLAAGHRWAASAGNGATLNGKPIRTRQGALGAIPSPAATHLQLANLTGLTRLRISGSTVSDLAHVADGSLAAFVALDRRVVHVHDLAAGMIVVEEAGGCVIDRTGARPVLVPDATVCMDIVASCNVDLARALAGLS